MRCAVDIVAGEIGEVPEEDLKSHFSYISCLRPLVVGGYLELYPLSLGQRLEPFSSYRRIVHEDVRSVVLLDESVTFGFVEPLHRSLKCHSRQTLLNPATQVADPETEFRECGQLIRTPY